MIIADATATSWRKSCYSGSSSNCVEVAYLPNAAAIRDSKNPDGGALVLDERTWASLLSAVRSGALDLP